MIEGLSHALGQNSRNASAPDLRIRSAGTHGSHPLHAKGKACRNYDDKANAEQKTKMMTRQDKPRHR
jgi:hypothetical protein